MIKRSLLKELQKYLTTSQIIFEDSTQWKQSLNRYALHNIQPLATVRCLTIDDVQTTIRFSNKHYIDFVIKAGGINQACTSIKPQHLVVDLSMMKRLTYVKQSSSHDLSITFEAGVNFKDIQNKISTINKELKSGYTIPLAFYRNISCVGAYSIGGNGVAHRICGYGVDLVKQAKVILWDGSLVTANRHQNKDLLWGIKGSGPSLGVIVQMQIQLQQSCNVLDPQQRQQIREYTYQFPINLQTTSMGQQLKLLCRKIPQKIFPHLFFIYSSNFSAIFLTFFQFLYNKSKNNLQSSNTLQTLMSQLFTKYNSKINEVKSQDKYSRETCLIDKQDRKKSYYYAFGGYSSIQHLPKVVEEIHKFYGDYPITQFNNSSVNLVIIINYLQSEAFQKRDTSSTSWESSKNDNLLLYGNVTFEDASLDQNCYQYMKVIRDRLGVYMVRGSACDFNKRDISERNMGKWIYGSNFDRLKGLKQKFDPFNKFKTDLL